MNAVAVQDHISRRERLGMPLAPAPIVRRELIPPPGRRLPWLRKKITKPAPQEPERLMWPSQPEAVFYDEMVPIVRGVVTVRSIIADACRHYGVSEKEFLGRGHFHQFVLARDEAAYRMTAELDMSLTAIGRRLNRDHTSILSALRRYVKRAPHARMTLGAVKQSRMARKANMKEQACDMFLAGKSMLQIMEALPISRSAIQTALARRRATMVNEPLMGEADTGVFANGDAFAEQV